MAFYSSLLSREKSRREDACPVTMSHPRSVGGGGEREETPLAGDAPQRPRQIEEARNLEPSMQQKCRERSNHSGVCRRTWFCFVKMGGST